MSGLDVLTERGQQSVRDEEQMVEIILRNIPGVTYLHTDKKSSAVVDAMLSRRGRVVAVAETKCRYDMGYDKLFSERRGEWLLTYEKLRAGAAIAKALRVPFVGFLFLVPDSAVLCIRLADERGNIIPPVRLERTQTQATTNGGEAVRTNAFVQMLTSKVYR